MRKLATVRRIGEIKPIENADAIEHVRVDGWWVVSKKNEFKVGDLVVYLEVDSWVPHELAPFLSKGKEPREYNGVKGEKLRTVKLRGAISQGLILPLTVINPRMDELKEHLDNAEGFDCTELLDIQKWERPISPQLAGLARGNFPDAVPKTDQNRIQNLGRNLEQWCANKEEWEVTEKLDGSSCTFYLDKENIFHVCSRNLDLKFDENNAFWQMALKYNIEEKMKELNLQGFAIQGELIGHKVNGNIYKMSGVDFYVFDVYNANIGSYVSANQRYDIAHALRLKHVPLLCFGAWFMTNEGDSVEVILNLAEGESDITEGVSREGLVFKNIKDPNVSFKAISNAWLLKNE